MYFKGKFGNITFMLIKSIIHVSFSPWYMPYKWENTCIAMEKNLEYGNNYLIKNGTIGYDLAYLIANFSWWLYKLISSWLCMFANYFSHTFLLVNVLYFGIRYSNLLREISFISLLEVNSKSHHLGFILQKILDTRDGATPSLAPTLTKFCAWIFF